MNSFNLSFLKLDLMSSKRLISAAIFLSKSSFKAQHSRNSLGAFWITIHSLAFLIFLTLLRHLFFGIQDVALDIARIFIAYSIFGLLVCPLRDGATYLLRNRAYLEGTNLPVSFFLLKTIIDSFRSIFYSWIIIPIVIIWSGSSFNFLSVPILLVWIFTYILLYCGIAGWLAPLVLKFPDIEQVIQSVITAGLFITPIWWKLDSLDSDFAKLLCSMNPFYWGIQSVQDVFLGGFADSRNLFKFLLFSVVNFAMGIVVFWAVKRKFLYWYR